MACAVKKGFICASWLSQKVYHYIVKIYLGLLPKYGSGWLQEMKKQDAIDMVCRKSKKTMNIWKLRKLDFWGFNLFLKVAFGATRLLAYKTRSSTNSTHQTFQYFLLSHRSRKVCELLCHQGNMEKLSWQLTQEAAASWTYWYWTVVIYRELPNMLSVEAWIQPV